MRKVYIWVDGSVFPNPGRGGVGFVAYSDDRKIRSGSKGYGRTTNNRMEISAALLALQRCKPDESVLIYSDSQYVTENYQTLMRKARDHHDIPNADLWRAMWRQWRKKQFVMHWIRGHSDEGIQQAHDLAYAAMKRGGKRHLDRGFKEAT